MESWVMRSGFMVCPKCSETWNKTTNETHRYKRCPNCGEELKSPEKHRTLDMKLVVSKTYCSPKKFKINGVNATTYDFGQGIDEEPPKAAEFGCGCHVFRHFEHPKHGILEKYHISMEDYRKICSQLDTQLSRGRCSYCG